MLSKLSFYLSLRNSLEASYSEYDIHSYWAYQGMPNGSKNCSQAWKVGFLKSVIRCWSLYRKNGTGGRLIHLPFTLLYHHTSIQYNHGSIRMNRCASQSLDLRHSGLRACRSLHGSSRLGKCCMDLRCGYRRVKLVRVQHLSHSILLCSSLGPSSM